MCEDSLGCCEYWFETLGNVEVGEDLKIELKGLFPQLYVKNLE